MPLPDNIVNGSKSVSNNEIIEIKDNPKVSSNKIGVFNGHEVQSGKKDDLKNVKVPDSPVLENAINPVPHNIQPQDPHPEVMEKLENEIKIFNEQLEQIQENRGSLIGVDYTRTQYGAIAFTGVEGSFFAVETLEFVEGILPHHVVEEFKIFEHMEGLSRFMSLSNTLLVALNSGLAGVALIYKTYLMDESEKLLDKVKYELQEKLDNKEISQEQFESLSKNLSNWEIQLELQRVSLNAERTVFGVSLISTVTKVVSEPIKYIPHEIALAGTFLSSTTILLKGFEVIITGIEYAHARHGKELTHEWIEKHDDWVKDHQYGFDRKAIDLKINLDRVVEKLSFNELKSVFEKVNFGDEKFTVALEMFKVKNKEGLITFFNDNPKIKADIAKKMITMFPAYEIKEFDPRDNGVKYITNQAEDLLSRRKIAKDNSILRIDYKSKETEIREMMYTSFKNTTKQFVRYTKEGKIVKNLDALNQWVIPGSENSIAVELNLRAKELSIQGKDMTDDDVNRLKMLIGVHGEELFNDWFNKLSIDKKLEFYVEHKNTYEKTAMSALNELIVHKHDLEKKFVDFKHSSSKLRFFVTAGLFVGSTILTVMGILTLPVPAVG
ncbi:MAG: hypothetical protein Q8K60_02220, partial [Parachlamydiaceae bacterium]|nr:hypothetical protein [Parachlamydiaceae bacterium]